MTVLVFELFGRHSSASRALNQVGQDSDNAGKRLTKLGQDADGASQKLGLLDNAIKSTTTNLLGNAKALGGFAVAAGLAATAVPPLVSGLVSAAQWIGAVWDAAVGASPALLAMGAGAGVVLASLKFGFSDFGTALAQADTPAQMKKVEKALAALHPEARKTAEVVRAMHPEFDKLKRSIQGNIFRDLADDVKATGTALMTSMGPGMARVGMSVNTVIRDLLSWGSATEGIKATANLSNSTATAMDRLAPSISRVVTSFGNMIGRIAEVSMSLGASGLGGMLDWLSGRMDRVNAATVTESWNTFKNKMTEVRDFLSTVWEAVQAGTRFYDEHSVAIGRVSDALAIVAIAFGGPVIAIGAATMLIIRHWDELKAAYAGLNEYFTTQPGILSAMEFLRSGMDVIMPSLVGAFNTIKEAVLPPLTEIWNKIQNELLPAFGAFYNAISPVIAILVDVLGPIVASVFGGIVQAISGAISIITGILNVFAGLLTGSWSRMWEGIKQIFSGAWDVIVGVLHFFIFGRIAGLLGGLPGLVGGLFGRAGGAALDAVRGMTYWVVNALHNLIRHIPGALGGLGDLLWGAGKAIVQGLINGILSMIGAAGNAMMSVVRKIRNMLPFSPAKEGPLSGSGSPEIAGRTLSGMVASGMLGGLPEIVAAAYRIAGAAGLALPGLPPMGVAGALPAGAAGAGVPRLTIDSAGSRMDDLIIEMIRRALRTQGGGDVRKWLEAA